MGLRTGGVGRRYSGSQASVTSEFADVMSLCVVAPHVCVNFVFLSWRRWQKFISSWRVCRKLVVVRSCLLISVCSLPQSLVTTAAPVLTSAIAKREEGNVLTAREYCMPSSRSLTLLSFLLFFFSIDFFCFSSSDIFTQPFIYLSLFFRRILDITRSSTADHMEGATTNIQLTLKPCIAPSNTLHPWCLATTLATTLAAWTPTTCKIEWRVTWADMDLRIRATRNSTILLCRWEKTLLPKSNFVKNIFRNCLIRFKLCQYSYLNEP